MKVLDLAYERIEKTLDELEVTDAYFRGLRAGLIDALELIDILDMELDGRLPAGDDVREHLKEQEVNENALPLDAVVIMGDGIAAQLRMLSGHATPKEKRGNRYWARTDSTIVDSPVTTPRHLPLTLIHPQDKEKK